MADVPVLQVIHITDLHFCQGDSDQARLYRQGRMLRLMLRKVLEKRDLFGWHEGTLDHDDTAEFAFMDFLRDMREGDAEWFPDEKDKANPPTWLVDTGDATTFGDKRSMEFAQGRFQKWAEILAGCEFRSLFGNHDTWPETQPGVMTGPRYDELADLQRTHVFEWNHWQPHRWLEPLVAPLPGGGAIECYALNTARFDWWDNLRAVGRVEASDLDALEATIRQSQPGSRLRILASHHPLAFPYESREEAIWFVQQMVLAKSGRVTRRLRNEDEEVAALRPLIHLFLSGHTHLGMPGQPLPGHVKEAYQSELGKTQLQLVSGALLLVRDREKVREAIGPQSVLKDRKDFSHPSVFDANQQFQILRFYFDAEKPTGVKLQRTVMARLPNSPDGYTPIPELGSETWMPLSQAMD